MIGRVLVTTMMTAMWAASLTSASFLPQPSVFSEEAQDGDKPVSLFDGESLEGWVVRGGRATYKVEDGCIVGRTTESSPNTFLCTAREYGDFELLLEVKCDPELNSGIQIRSHVYEKDTPQASKPRRIREAGEVYGLQCEITARARGTSGNFWDEARHTRWHDDFENKPEARKAFRDGEWNRYRIVARTDRVRSWVNGVPCADFRSSEDRKGFIGLQVHGIRRGSGPYEVRWRNIRIRELKDARGDQRPGRRAPGRFDAAAFVERLKANDQNGDGKISREEAPDRLKRAFGRVDGDKDGFLDDGELRKWVAGFRGRGQPGRTRRRPSDPGQRERPVQVPPGVRFEPNIAYRQGNEAWRLDLALPEDRGDSPRPGLVFVHGGGWRSGDKRRGYFLEGALDYARKGYVCITVNYRLTGDAPFPACVEDVKCAVRWFRANAGKYNVDPKRIGGYGNSAGAHLVAMLGLAGRDAGLEGDGPHAEQSSLLNAVCASATPTDFLHWKGRGNGGFLRTGLLGGPEATFRERARKASPITHVHAGAPPFLVFHGTADRTVPVGQGDRFVKALRDTGARDVKYERFDGEGHGVFNQRRAETHPAMEAFFARTIGKRAERQGTGSLRKDKKP
ncbi:MAG: DUF1080 domain-containing protein [Planctomycetota bacterium]|nr:DUF1080 domain-containing protein [Planctomycetota bacterium]